MATIAISGSASGIGAATAARLREGGHDVVGIDLRAADVCCDLATPDGRREAVRQVLDRCAGRLDGLVTSAGIGGSTTSPGGRLVAVNYFGTVDLLQGLRPALAAAGQAAVVCLSSNSASCQPDWPAEIAQACLDGDEQLACEVADGHASYQAYPATKAALAWYVRRHAPSVQWAGSGIRLNALAPGLIDTPLSRAQQTDPVLGPAVRSFPIPRGQPGAAEEVAAVVEFMLGPDAALLIGSVLYADGGTDALLRPDDWPARWQLA